jgi:hypothetical protein
MPAEGGVVADDVLPTATPIGRILVDARVPAEIRVDGKPLVQLWIPGRLEFAAPVGDHTLTATVGGDPVEVPVTVPLGPEQRAVVVIGRTGTTAHTEVTAESTANPAQVEVRVAGPGSVQVRVDDRRWTLTSAKTLSLDLAAGGHPVTLRSQDGTVIWATGTLSIIGGDSVVVQVSEGRLPEVSGNGSYFAAGG